MRREWSVTTSGLAARFDIPLAFVFLFFIFHLVRFVVLHSFLFELH